MTSPVTDAMVMRSPTFTPDLPMIKKYAATESRIVCSPTAIPAVTKPAKVASELN